MDWRLTNQINYLYRATLIKQVYKKTLHSDHEHCEFCWNKFSESLDSLNWGYCTRDKYHWICERCFLDFKDQFEWLIDDRN